MKNESREVEKLAEAMAHADWLGKNAPEHSETGMMASLAAEVRRLEALAVVLAKAIDSAYCECSSLAPVECSSCALRAQVSEHIAALLSKAAKSQEGAARKINGVKSRYLIHCKLDDDFGSCGESSYLTRAQYDEQMANPNKGWRCPQCNCYPCAFDDANFKEKP